MRLTITGYSTALFSSWYFIDELGLLLDAGDGVTSALLQKARKIENVFISHADRDHLTGLLQFNQLNARPGLPIIHFPFDCGSFPALELFSKNFDPHVSGTNWRPIKENEEIQVRDGLYVQPVRNNHVQAEPQIVKSLGYCLYEIKSKLKKEFAGYPKNKMRDLIEERGKENVTEQVRTNLLTYSGDTPVDEFEKWNNTSILIHEATFLGKQEQINLNRQGNKHSNLEDVMEMAAQLNIEKLILGHFSTRYSAEEIIQKIISLCKLLSIKIPVYAVLPGQVHRDILNQAPVNEHYL